ncbi:hypothetical protein [Actinomadura sp. WMMA1423]|uniref:hypothetical protein n=1 Tax=Actinomadura sp. WMMA1423 TaxID=2591108 RepID=UPI00143DC48A|nr:hypothetical protein [Actinomadura sp. WMMA1423]
MAASVIDRFRGLAADEPDPLSLDLSFEHALDPAPGMPPSARTVRIPVGRALH